MSSSSSLARGTDIIDLDRYMRDSVRPSDPRHARERLVVDAGGAGRVPVGGVGGVGAVGGVGDVGGTDSERAGGERRKRYWHDSGLSDSSYAKRRQKPHRCYGEAERRARVSVRPRPVASHSSERAFRAACESALREQQQQLARVAELCQRALNTPTPRTDPPADSRPPCGRNAVESALAAQKNIEVQTKRSFGQNVSPSARRRGASDSSDVTSTSSGDERKRDRRRTESCKTYAIIMSKLDELGRLLAARRALAPAPPTAPAPALLVSKRDQFVATEDPATAVQVVHVRRAPRSRRCGGDADSFGWGSGSSGLSDAHPYDMSDPLHAKRLQAVHAADRRAKPAGSAPDKLSNRSDDGLDDRLGDKLGGSLCALCRGYWRALRRCVTQQLFGACS